MLPVMALALVLGQSPVVTPPAGQQPIDFPAPGEPLRVEGGAIAWQGPNYWVAWTDRRRAFDVPTAPADVWVGEWNDRARTLSQVGPRFGNGALWDVKLAVSRTDSRVYAVRVDDDGGVQVLTSSLFGAPTGGPITAGPEARGGIAVAAVEDEFLLAIRSGGTVRLIREGQTEQVTSAPGIADLRVTGIDGGFLVSFIDSIGPRFVVVPLGQAMSSRSAQPLSLMPAPNLVAPVPSEPTSFIVSSNTLTYYLPDAGQLLSQPIDTQTSPRLLVAPNSSFAVMARSIGVHTVPIGGGQVRSRLFDAGLPLGLAVQEDAGVLFASSSGNATLLPLNISPTGEATTGPLFELKSGAPQRAPTAIWSSAANLFLVAWEQRSAAGFEVRIRGIDRAGNESATQPISAVPLAGGLDPRLLEAPDGGGVAIQLRVLTDAGLQTAVSLVNPTTLALGPTFGAFSAQDRVLYHPVSVVWAQTNPTSVRDVGTLPFPAPRCVAGTGGKAFFAGVGNNQVVVATAPGPDSLFRQLTRPVPEAPGCAAVGLDGTVMVVARAGSSIQFLHLNTGLQILGELGVQEFATGDPVVTALGAGFLVAWPAGTNIVAYEVKQPGISLTPVVLGPSMGVVNEVVATASPFGDALLTWQAFDAQNGHAVWARVVSVPGFDGGIALDAGVGVRDGGFGVVDAGLVDGGGVVVADAGVVVEDGGAVAVDGGVVIVDGGVGVVDGGVVAEDAGVVVVDGGVVAEDGGVVIVDAGAAVDGGPGEVEFVPVCGCSAVDPRLVVLLALVALTRRRGREAARDVFR